MIRKILEKFRNHNRSNHKQENFPVCWPCDWNYSDVEKFNAFLSGLSS